VARLLKRSYFNLKMLFKWYVLRNRPEKLIEILFPIAVKYNLKSVLNYTIKCEVAQQDDYGQKIYSLAPEEVVINKTPKILNLGILDTEIKVMVPERTIHLYKDAVVRANSSFIYLGYDSENPKVIIEKLKYPTNIKSIIAETRLAVNDDYWTFTRKPKRINLDLVLSFAGHYSNHFGHFILEYLERFEHLNHLGVDIGQLNILLQNPLDRNIRELVEQRKHEFGFKLIEIDSQTEVYAKRLFTIDPMNIVTDGANYASVTDKLFRRGSFDYYSSFQSAQLNGQGGKVFLKKTGVRNLVNYDEVEKLFADKGYEVVEPSNLTILEKLQLFSKTSYVVGPGSSAFLNCFWCPIDVKIMVFINYEIAFDNPLQNMLSNPENIYYLAGKEFNYTFYNSDYMIDIDTIKKYSIKLGFI
jgi:hypothetical protein